MAQFRRMPVWAMILPFFSAAWAQNSPVISLVANAEGENAVIAPNTWVEIKGTHLAGNGDSRTWQGSDFHNNQLPVSLDGVSVTVNGKAAYVYYISPTQVNVLTPPDAMPGSVAVQVTNNGQASAAVSVKAQAASPSFFNINGGPYVVAQHGADYSLVGPPSLYPGASTPAKPGETVILYANGFGPTTPAAVSGAMTQTGSLSPLPAVAIGGIAAEVQFGGLVSPGLFQINVVVPANAPSGDNALTATLNGVPAAPVALITVQGPAAAPATATFYVAPNGSDAWSGRLAAPNSAGSDGPLATFDRARAMVQSIVKAGLTQINVQFRGGTYYLPATVMFGAADSGTASMEIVYQNYPGEAPVFSGGVRVGNWIHTGGNTWKAALPASTQYFENLFYNGARRLRPRLGATATSPLGSYYRIANTVYLNAPGPPAAAPSPTCAVYIPGSGWECFDRFQYSATDPIVEHVEKPGAGERESVRPGGGESGHRGRYRGAGLRAVQHVEAAHQLRGRDEPDGLPDRSHGLFAKQSQRGWFHRRQPVPGGECRGRADAAGAMVPGPLGHSVDADVPGEPGRGPERRHGGDSASCAAAGGIEPEVCHFSGADFRAR